MSAFGAKADIKWCWSKSPLLTQSRHPALALVSKQRVRNCDFSSSGLSHHDIRIYEAIGVIRPRRSTVSLCQINVRGRIDELCFSVYGRRG